LRLGQSIIAPTMCSLRTIESSALPLPATAAAERPRRPSVPRRRPSVPRVTTARTHASVRCQCARACVCVCVFVSWRVCACVRARARVLVCASVRLSACVRACARASLPFCARMGPPQRARVGDRHRIGSCSFSTMASSLKAISLPVLSLQPPPAHGRSCAEPAMAMVRDSPAAARTQRPPAAQWQQLCAISSSGYAGSSGEAWTDGGIGGHE
jgi:hypothetical protein